MGPRGPERDDSQPSLNDEEERREADRRPGVVGLGAVVTREDALRRARELAG